jgi:hypothetical protein
MIGVLPRTDMKGVAVIDELDKRDPEDMEIKSIDDYYECYLCGHLTKLESFYCVIACQKCMTKRVDWRINSRMKKGKRRLRGDLGIIKIGDTGLGKQI